MFRIAPLDVDDEEEDDDDDAVVDASTITASSYDLSKSIPGQYDRLTGNRRAI